MTRNSEGRYVATPRDLTAIRADYEGNVIPLPEVADTHCISVSTLHRLARENGWRPRSPRRIDRNDIIERMFRLLDRHIRELEKAVTDQNTDQAAVLGRLVSTLDKLIAIKDAEAAKHPAPRRSSKAMLTLRAQIADRIAHFAQP